MIINYSVSGSGRKRLVAAIAEHTGEKAKYLGAPSFAYQVDYITIDKSGVLHMDDNADPDTIQSLMGQLEAAGFRCFSHDYDNPQPEPETEDNSIADAFSGLCISMPRSLFTDNNLENLKALISAKGSLIKKALGVDALPLEITDTKVSFPWFPGEPSPEEIKAYDFFICKLCEMARNQKRVVAKEKESDNEKYTFRCFLLRLGFIGDEYKAARKILLRNFTGSSAFKDGARVKEVAK